MNTPQNPKKVGPYELFILFITFLSFIILCLIFFWPVSEETYTILITYDVLISFVFLIDFLKSYSRAKDKKQYFFKQLGWLDLLGSIPFPAFTLARIARFIKILRTIKNMRRQELGRQIIEHRANYVLSFTIILAISIISIASLVVYEAEYSLAESNIKTMGESYWWAFVTVTTVGYGDYSPISLTGRIAATLLMIVGVGVFSVFSSYLAKVFLGGKKYDNNDGTDPSDELAEVKKELKEIKELIKNK